jgi:sigma-B regulation protein RsbU (phosphoserine phosphatase)
VYSHIHTPDSLHSVTQHLVRKNSTIVGSCAALVPENKVSHGKSFAPYSCVIGSEIIDKQLGSEEYDYVNKDWYKNAISSGKTCWSEPYFDKDGINKDICTLSSPLRDNDGNIFAVFTADISLEWLTDIVNEGLPFENSYALITNAVGTYVIHPKKERIAKGNIFDAPENIDNPETQAFARNMIAGKSGQTEIKENGDSYFVCYAPINQTTWSLAIVSPHGDIFSIHNKMSIFMFIGLILSLLIISGVCVFIIKRITKPLTEFSAAALRISQGYFNIALPEIKVKDEIWELRESLDQMQYNLSRYTNRLKEVSANKAVSDRDEFIASKIQVQMLPPTFEKMVV